MLDYCALYADFVETGHAPSPKRNGDDICGFVYVMSKKSHNIVKNVNYYPKNHIFAPKNIGFIV